MRRLTKKQTAQSIVKRMQEALDDTDPSASGICVLISGLLTGRCVDTLWDIKKMLTEVCKDLDVYSGSYLYPIKFGNCPKRTYHTCMDKFSRETEYGQLRRKVTEELIKRIKEKYQC